MIGVILILVVFIGYSILSGVVVVECLYLDENTTMDIDMSFSFLLAAFAPITFIALGVVCCYYYATEEDDETSEKRWCKWFQKHVDKMKKL